MEAALTRWLVSLCSKCSHPIANGDFHVVDELEEGRLLLVAGSAFGDSPTGDIVATRQRVAQIVIDAILDEVRTNCSEPIQALADGFEAADTALRSLLASWEREWEPPAATALAVMVVGERAHLAWVGGFRAYHIRGRKVRAITREHSLMRATEEERGEVDDAQRFPAEDIVVRVLGFDEASSREPIGALDNPWQLEPGDTLLICSPSVWSRLDEGEIVSLSSETDGAARLVDATIMQTIRPATVILARSA